MGRLNATITRLYLDTNVFIRAFEGKDDVATALRAMLTSHPDAAEPFLITSELTSMELLVQPYRERDEQLIQTYENWSISNDYLEVAPIVRPVLKHAAMIRAQYPSIKTPDAIHISTALGARCSHLLSDDLRMSGRYSLDAFMFGRLGGAVDVEIVRPDLDLILGLWEPT